MLHSIGKTIHEPLFVKRTTIHTMNLRFLTLNVFLCALLFVSCDTNNDEDSCLTVTPDENYELSGETMTTAFTPASKTYTVSNTCSEDVLFSVEENVRWLDVEIEAFGGVDESGTLEAGATINVDIEVRYGGDDIQRLNQLPPGIYRTELRFNDDGNDTRITHIADLTVTSSP